MNTMIAAMPSSTALALSQAARRASWRRMQQLAAPRVGSSRSRRVLRHASSDAAGGPASPAELHSLYHTQMKEIQAEREEMFGAAAADAAAEGPEPSQAAPSYFEEANKSAEGAERSPAESPPSAPIPSVSRTPPPGWSAAQSAEASQARDAMYAFSDAEQSAWKNRDEAASNIHRIRRLVEEHDAGRGEATQAPPQSTAGDGPAPSPFSHLTPRGDGVRMVDVGRKAVTRRAAVARTEVVFPPEVLAAFDVVGAGGTELIGPKGPIFETAKIAGIMGAK